MSVQIEQDEDTQIFKRHVQSRWMIMPAMNRVLEQLTVLRTRKDFSELPKKKQNKIEKTTDSSAFENL